MGILSSNSFAKRESGKKLIEEVLPRLDLTRILDTSGAYIPGHGIPTLILVGRNRPPQSNHVRIVAGKRGEPIMPVHPEQGRVWSTLAAHHDDAGFENEYIAVADVSRAELARHPWTLSGREAAILREALNGGIPLEQVVARVGVGGMSGLDALFAMPSGVPERLGLEHEVTRPLITDESVNDWAAVANMAALVPYAGDQEELLPLGPEARWARFLWRYRVLLQHQATGAQWWGWSSWSGRPEGPRIVGRAIVRSNDFALDPGVAWQRSVLVIELLPASSHDDAFALLGYLNSSMACYWLKMSSLFDPDAPPGLPSYDFGGSVHRLPVPETIAAASPMRTELIMLARRLHETALARVASTPEWVLTRWDGGSRRDLMRALASAQQREATLAHQMVCDQEDLDWLVYAAIGLVPGPPHRAEGVARPEQRPFAWLSDQPPAGLDPRLVFVWTQRRQALMRDPSLRLVESAPYKRPFRDAGGEPSSPPQDPEEADIEGDSRRVRLSWMTARANDMDRRITAAGERWLLDRLENALRTMSAPRCLSVADLASRLASMDGANAVTALAGDREPRELADQVSSLLQANAVPFLAALRHTESGLSKCAVWEKTWALQRRQDAGEPVEPPMPPHYRSEDYRDAISWWHRGKLDVPTERFIAYPDAGSDDQSRLYGWAGWDEDQRARVLVALYDERRHRNGWTPARLCPLLAGLLELAPWTRQRRNSGGGVERERCDYERFVAMEAQALGLAMEEIRAWRPQSGQRRRNMDRGSRKE